jgi:hypothetical protein
METIVQSLKKEIPMKSTQTLLVLLILTCVVGLKSNAVATETNTVSDCSIPWNFSTIARETDAIVIGKAISMKGAFLNPYHHIDFYIIDVAEHILSEEKHIILAVYQNKFSSFGYPIQPQQNMEYLFFLKNCDESFEHLPSQDTVYETVRYWQGIIPFDIKAKENRSVRRIKEQYNIDIYEERNSFVEAIRATVAEKNKSETGEGKQLSEEAIVLFSRLKLTRDFFIPTEPPEE